ncbi:hypothetical protein BKP30_27645 [Rhodococcus erythropolis]|nr:hypothetical protein BKP30_27645 [Rhodococcus erythropolis]
MEGKRTEATIGLEVTARTSMYAPTKPGTHVALDVDGRTATVPCAEPMVIPGLVSGMLTVEQAISASALVVPSRPLVALPDCS